MCVCVCVCVFFLLYHLFLGADLVVCRLNLINAELSPPKRQGLLPRTKIPGGEEEVGTSVIVTTTKTPALRWAAMRPILTFSLIVRDEVKRQCPQTTTVEERAEAEWNRCVTSRPNRLTPWAESSPSLLCVPPGQLMFINVLCSCYSRVLQGRLS